MLELILDHIWFIWICFCSSLFPARSHPYILYLSLRSEKKTHFFWNSLTSRIFGVGSWNFYRIRISFWNARIRVVFLIRRTLVRIFIGGLENQKKYWSKKMKRIFPKIRDFVTERRFFTHLFWLFQILQLREFWELEAEFFTGTGSRSETHESG